MFWAAAVVISRENQAVKPAVFTIGSIHSGQTHNSIPAEVEMLGTLRSLYPECREKNLEAIRRITKGVCESMRAEGIVEVSVAYLPPVFNDDQVVDGIVEAANQVLGDGHPAVCAGPGRRRTAAGKL